MFVYRWIACIAFEESEKEENRCDLVSAHLPSFLCLVFNDVVEAKEKHSNLWQMIFEVRCFEHHYKC